MSGGIAVRNVDPAQTYVQADVLGDGNSTVARVTVHIPGKKNGQRSFTASAKKHPSDLTYNAIGVELALARAMKKAARWLEREAEADVKYNTIGLEKLRRALLEV